MKIIEIRITPVAIPLKEHYHWAGRADSEASPILVEVESDEGIVGIGECSASFVDAGLGRRCCAGRRCDGERMRRGGLVFD